MALSTATIAYSLDDLLGVDLVPNTATLGVRTNIPDETVVDTVGNEIRLGPTGGKLATGAGSVVVWVPGTGSNPDTWQTYFDVTYQTFVSQPSGGYARQRRTRTFGPFTITGDANLADLVDEQEVPPTYLTTVTATLDGYVDDAEDARDAAAASAAEAAASAATAVDISGIATPDGVVSALIELEGSDTQDALAASYVGKIKPATGVAATDTANVLAAFADAVTAGGGQLVAGGGVYLINQIIEFPTAVSVNLDMAGSTFKMANGADLDAVIQTEDWDTLTGTGSVEGMTRVKIANGIIDGNKANNSAGYAARFYGWAYEVKHMIFQNGSDGGLVTEWGLDRSGVDVDTAMEAFFTHIQCMNNGGDGWLHHGPHDSQIVGVTCKQNTGWGFKNGYDPGGYNGIGAHIWNMNCWNNDLGGADFEVSVVGHDVAVSAPATKAGIRIGPDSGPCVLTGMTAAGGGAGVATGIEILSQGHRVQGYVGNASIGVDLTGANACDVDVVISNCSTAIDFTGDGGVNTIRAKVITLTGQVLSSGTAGVSDTLMIECIGDVSTNIFQTPGAIKSFGNLLAASNVYAAHDSADQSGFGFMGPGGEMGLDLKGEKLYRDSAGILRTGSWFQVDGILWTGSAWDGSHLRLGSYNLWVDATGDLRIKSGAVASDTDGTVVGTQT